MDETRAVQDAPPEGKSPRSAAGQEAGPAGPSRAYSDAARAERQLRITELIPIQPWRLALLMLVGLSLIAGCQVLYKYVYLQNWLAAGELTALDLAGQGSVAGWFSSLLLSLAALGAGLVFSLRRHRIDDYRGRYRVWTWTAGLLLLGSLDVATGLHQALPAVLAQLTGTALYGDTRLWWILPYGLVMSGWAMRLFLEIRSSRAAAASLALAAASYLLGAIGGLGWFLSPNDVAAVLFASSTTMLGHLLLTLTVWSYARYVYLDAQGQLPPRTPWGRKAPLRPAEERPVEQGKAFSSGQASPAAKRGGRVRIDNAHHDSPAQGSDPQSAAATAASSPQTTASAAPVEKQRASGGARKIRLQPVEQSEPESHAEAESDSAVSEPPLEETRVAAGEADTAGESSSLDRSERRRQRKAEKKKKKRRELEE